MKRTTIFIEEHLERELRAIARRSARPMASLVREAVERYVAAARQDSPARLRFVAAGRSSRRDTAERHEEMLFERDTAASPIARPAKSRPPRRRTRTRR